MIKINLNNKTWQWVTLIFMAFIWGTSFILMKKGLESYNNLQVAALRIFFSFIFLFPFLFKNLKKLTRKNFVSLLIFGFVGNAIPAFLFTTAQTQISSSLAGIINSLTPLFTLIVGVLLYRSNVKFFNVLGILIGFIGAAGLLLKKTSGAFEGINGFALLIVLATLCYGINSNVIKYKLKELSSIEIMSLGFMFIGPFAGIFLLFSDFSHAVTTENYLINLCYIAILALFSSVIALTIFNILIKYTTTIFATSVTYIIPIFAILWGLFDGEKITMFQIICIIIIFLGVYLVNKNSKKR